MSEPLDAFGTCEGVERHVPGVRWYRHRKPLARPADAEARRGKPNIVFVLTDDLSWNLVDHMANVQRMQREGMTFSRYFVTDYGGYGIRAPGRYQRWIRYGDDLLLVNVRNGRVVRILPGGYY